MRFIYLKFINNEFVWELYFKSMKLRITLINNLNHNHKTVLLINDLLKIAKNKLKLPQACILYLKGGSPDITSLKNNETIYVSCGELYAGPKQIKTPGPLEPQYMCWKNFFNSSSPTVEKGVLYY